MIVAAYRSGDAINRVIDSLDAQTLPHSEFETIIVDDGSPDDTYERLLELAATRPNLRVSRIENSGWPSRPRNLATEQARGEYVLYMDHDDSLYPSALERIVAFAAETGADVISPKESKTSEVWWAMPAMAGGNAADVKASDAIGRILPMVPHKVYRREFLRSNRIAFPEGRRQLWEDVYFNVEAWAKATRGVAVLADTPVYLWHDSGENNSGTYGATDAEYWDRLDELMAFIDRTLSGPEDAVVHKTMLVHQYQGRVLRRLGRQLQGTSAEEVAEAIRRAQAIQQRHIPEDWDPRLGFFAQLRAWLLRHNRPELLLQLHQAYEGVSMQTTVRRAEWVGGALEIETESRWVTKNADALGFVRVGDRVLMDLPATLVDAVPPEALDVTGRLERFQQTFGVRARAEMITWQVPAETRVELRNASGEAVLGPFIAGAWAATAGVPGTATALAAEAQALANAPVARTSGSAAREAVSLVTRSVVRIDPGTVACGAPLAETVWDLTTISRWDALTKGSALSYSGPELPALVNGLAGVAYPTRTHKLAIDLGGRLRNVPFAAELVAGAGGAGSGGARPRGARSGEANSGGDNTGGVAGESVGESSAGLAGESVGEAAAGWSGRAKLILPLGGVHVAGTTDRPITLTWSRGSGGSVSADAVAADARLVGDALGARLEFESRPRPGFYRLAGTGGDGQVSDALVRVTLWHARVLDRPPHKTLRARLRRVSAAVGWRLRRVAAAVGRRLRRH